MRDVGLAEDLAQDALVAALEQWPRVRRPGQPGRLAHGDREAPRDRPAAPARRVLERKHEELARELEAERAVEAASSSAALDDGSATTCCGLIFIVLPSGALDRRRGSR